MDRGESPPSSLDNAVGSFWSTGTLAGTRTSCGGAFASPPRVGAATVTVLEEPKLYKKAIGLGLGVGGYVATKESAGSSEMYDWSCPAKAKEKHEL